MKKSLNLEILWEGYQQIHVPMHFSENPFLAEKRIDFELDDTFGAGLVSSKLQEAPLNMLALKNCIDNLKNLLDALKKFQPDNQKTADEKLLFEKKTRLLLEMLLILHS